MQNPVGMSVRREWEKDTHTPPRAAKDGIGPREVKLEKKRRWHETELTVTFFIGLDKRLIRMVRGLIFLSKGVN
jgi:hypothetical protein